MKIRTSFVSNSSSSSFIIIGEKMNNIDIDTIINNIEEENKNEFLDKFKKLGEDEKDHYNVNEILESISDKRILSGIEDGLNEDEMVIGKIEDIDEDSYFELEITEDMVGKKIICSTRMD